MEWAAAHSNGASADSGKGSSTSKKLAPARANATAASPAADGLGGRITARALNGAIGLFVPKTVIGQRCTLYMSGGQPAQRGQLLHDDDFTIVAKFQAEYRGLVQYYLLAQDVFRLGKLQWVMETSLLKTLAGKHRSTVTKMARKYKATTETSFGPHKCLQVTVQRDGRKKPLVARFGGIPLKRQPTAGAPRGHAFRGIRDLGRCRTRQSGEVGRVEYGRAWDSSELLCRRQHCPCDRDPARISRLST